MRLNFLVFHFLLSVATCLHILSATFKSLQNHGTVWFIESPNAPDIAFFGWHVHPRAVQTVSVLPPRKAQFLLCLESISTRFPFFCELKVPLKMAHLSVILRVFPLYFLWFFCVFFLAEQYKTGVFLASEQCQ